MGRKKQFIDKKHAVTFEVVHRSQRDPLAADEEAPQYVLKQVYGPGEQPQMEEEQFIDPQEIEDELQLEGEDDEEAGEELDPFADADEDEDGGAQDPKGKSRAKGKGKSDGGEKFRGNPDYEYGHLGFNDGYDYSKHMREMGSGVFYSHKKEASSAKNSATFQLQDLMASKEEEEIGLLNKAAPVTGPAPEGVDPEVFHALETVDGEEWGELEDDFILKANAEGSDDDNEGGGDYYEGHGGAGGSSGDTRVDFSGAPYRGGDGDSDDDSEFSSEHSAGRSTSYASTYIRNAQPRLQDDHLDALMEEKYRQEDIGALEDGDPAMAGLADISQFDDVMDEFLQEHSRYGSEFSKVLDGQKVGDEDRVEVDRERYRYEEDDESKKKQVEYVEQEEEGDEDQWDCESIVSTYSNLENHPGKIQAPPKPKKQIRLDKDGVPIDYVPSRRNNEEEEDESSSEEEVEVVNLGQARARKESKEEKKARKAAVKESRRNQRQKKKEMKIAFGQELQKQSKQNANPDNQGLKLFKL